MVVPLIVTDRGAKRHHPSPDSDHDGGRHLGPSQVPPVRVRVTEPRGMGEPFMVVVATDIGGTFTDIVAIEASGRLTISKVHSTPADYADGLLDGVVSCFQAKGGGRSPRSPGSCTAVRWRRMRSWKRSREDRTGDDGRLSRRPGAAPDSRAAACEPLYQRPDPLVPRNRRLEVAERVATNSSVVTAVERADSTHWWPDAAGKRRSDCRLPDQSACNPTHERMIGEALATAFPGVLVLVGGCSATAQVQAHRHHGGQCLHRSAPGSRSISPAWRPGLSGDGHGSP